MSTSSHRLLRPTRLGRDDRPVEVRGRPGHRSHLQRDRRFDHQLDRRHHDPRAGQLHRLLHAGRQTDLPVPAAQAPDPAVLGARRHRRVPGLHSVPRREDGEHHRRQVDLPDRRYRGLLQRARSGQSRQHHRREDTARDPATDDRSHRTEPQGTVGHLAAAGQGTGAQDRRRGTPGGVPESLRDDRRGHRSAARRQTHDDPVPALESRDPGFHHQEYGGTGIAVHGPRSERSVPRSA